jgi:hypothetical protein
MFRKLVEARDRLLAALGTRAPPPKLPSYAPMGKRMIYRRTSVRPQQGRIGSDPPSAELTRCTAARAVIFAVWLLHSTVATMKTRTDK